MLRKKIALYANLMRMDRPIGTVLLLWPTYWALWLAQDGTPPLYIFMIFTIGTFLMRSAGCIINDYADRDFDPHVWRTKMRPLAARTVTVKEALILAAVLCILSFILILPLNHFTWLMSIPALFVAASYPFMKRFFAIPQAYLGIAFGFGIPMGYAAIQNALPLDCWLMLLANVFWSVAYDTLYAMADKEDDLKIGIKTSAITFGRFDRVAIFLCHLCFLGLMTLVGVRMALSIAYYLGLIAAFILILYEINMTKGRDPLRCFAAFMHNNWVGMVIFIGILLHYYL